MDNANEILTNCFIDNQKRLFLTALTITKKRHLAEDALQDLFVKIIEKSHQLKDVKFVKTWITRILINTCKDLLKHKATVDNVNTSFACESYNVEEIRFLDIINSLPIKDREIVTLKYFYGYNFNEISSILKIPVSTAKSRLHRALEKMKNEWSD